MSDFIDDELLKDFFDEAYSLVEVVESNMLILEKDTGNKEAIDAIFRAAHTLKGGSATVQMDELAKFTHLMEDAMDEVRNGRVSVDSKIIDVLLSALDVIKAMLQSRSDGSVYSDDISSTVSQLQQIVDSVNAVPETKAPAAAEVTVAAPEPAAPAAESEDATFSEYDMLEFTEANPDNLPLYEVDVTFDETNPMRTVGAVQVFTSLRDIATVVKTIPDFEELYGETFYQNVSYIIATNESVQNIEKYTTISDTTKAIKITQIKNDGTTQSATAKPAKKQETKKAEPAKQPAKEPEKKVEPKSEYNDIEEMAKMIAGEVSLKKANEEKQNIIKINQEIQESKPAEKPNAPAAASPAAAANKPKAETHTQSSVLRVESSKIDDLLNLVSEIVINKATFGQVSLQMTQSIELYNETSSKFKEKLKSFLPKVMALSSITDEKQLAQERKEIMQEYSHFIDMFDPFMAQYKSTVDRFRTNAQNLDRISSSLQEGVMRVRMVQIKQTFSRFPRLVRDLSRNLNKPVELIMEGEETEIDKAMIDDLIDPLIHIIRNAVDHGLETQAERDAAGKKEPATVRLSAFSEGNLIIITVSDNGRGINVDKVRKKAIEKGVITADKVIKDQDAYNLIFEPGFSTADKITSVSGRGVGLDVVKKNIEKLSGTIKVESEYGRGSKFIIKLPLTLAIIQGLMIRVQDEIYAIPISSVLESLRVKPEEIKKIDNHEVINVREDVLSLLRLNRLFKFPEENESSTYFVVIVGTSEKKIGLLVDSLVGEEDIVIKPLNDKYTNTPGIAGATILGDGTVSLILDVAQLIELGLKDNQEDKQKISF